MIDMLADYRLYLVLAAAFVAGYVRTADDRGEREPDRDRDPDRAGVKGRLAAAADLLFLAALPLVGLLFWRHGAFAGAASLVGAWAVALVGDLAYQRRHTPPAQRPGNPRPLNRFEPMSGLVPVGISRTAGRAAPPQFPAGQFPRHVRYRRSTPAGRGSPPRH